MHSEHIEEIVFTEQQRDQLRQLAAALERAAERRSDRDGKLALLTKAGLCHSLANNDRLTPGKRREEFFKPW